MSLCLIEKKETTNIIANKESNEYSSKNSNENTTAKINEKNNNKIIYSYKESYKNKEALIKYLKNECPYFIEKFELKDYLKSGGFGAVMTALPINPSYKNKNNKKKLIALKFLDLSSSKEENNIKHSEIMIHGKLKYKNIPEIYGYYKIKENSCIAMNYNLYGDLENFSKKIIKNNILSESFICYILGNIAETVYFLHTNHKIIHMDIKP